MNAQQLRTARLSLGLTLSQMAAALGYEGKHASQQVRKMETGDRTIREAQKRLVEAYLSGYRPKDWPKPKSKEKTNG